MKKVFRYILISVVIAIILIGGYYLWQKKNTIKTYTNTDLGFSINYPKGWDNPSPDTEWAEVLIKNSRDIELDTDCYASAATAFQEIKITNFGLFSNQSLNKLIINESLLEDHINNVGNYEILDKLRFKDGYTLLITRIINKLPYCFVEEYTGWAIEGGEMWKIDIKWDYDNYQLAKSIFESFSLIDLSESKEYETYSNEELGFQIDYPKGWRENTLTSAGDLDSIRFEGFEKLPDFYKRPERCNDLKNTESLNIYKGKNFPGGGTSTKVELKDYLDKTKIPVRQKITLQSGETFFISSGEAPCTMRSYRGYLITEKGDHWHIRYDANDNDYDFAKRIFESFRLIKLSF